MEAGSLHEKVKRTRSSVVLGLSKGDISLAEATCNCGSCRAALEEAFSKCSTHPDPVKRARARAIQAKLAELREPAKPPEPEIEFPTIEV